MSRSRSQSMLDPLTSSSMPTVNRRRGCSAASSSKTPVTIPGGNSLEDRPYRPPITNGIGRVPSCASASAAMTSRNSGSPREPGSLVRSSTAIRRTEARQRGEQVRRREGPVQPDGHHAHPLPAATRWATVSRAVCAPDPMRTTTRSASGWPLYSTVRYLRPVRVANASIAAETSAGTRA